MPAKEEERPLLHPGFARGNGDAVVVVVLPDADDDASALLCIQIAQGEEGKDGGGEREIVYNARRKPP